MDADSSTPAPLITDDFTESLHSPRLIQAHSAMSNAVSIFVPLAGSLLAIVRACELAPDNGHRRQLSRSSSSRP